VGADATAGIGAATVADAAVGAAITRGAEAAVGAEAATGEEVTPDAEVEAAGKVDGEEKSNTVGWKSTSSTPSSETPSETLTTSLVLPEPTELLLIKGDSNWSGVRETFKRSTLVGNRSKVEWTMERMVSEFKSAGTEF
jgi:hypothetical protein